MRYPYASGGYSLRRTAESTVDLFSLQVGFIGIEPDYIAANNACKPLHITPKSAFIYIQLEASQVGREALESSSPAHQTSAKPSQLPTQVIVAEFGSPQESLLDSASFTHTEHPTTT